jgi:hypothetical protein
MKPAHPLRPYRVTIRRGSQVARSFDAMSSDSCACAIQHMDLCGDGEKIEVVGLAEARAIVRDPFAANDRRALEGQVAGQARDPLMQGVYS